MSGFFGYGYATGGFAGLQAEYARVPVADVNLLVVDEKLKDSEILGLSDILCTGWHGLEIGGVKENDIVVIWGAGPVGLATLYLAKKLVGVKRVICIDFDEYRLKVAKDHGAEIISRQNIDIKRNYWKCFHKVKMYQLTVLASFHSHQS
jgi:threonine dehydrogenase-like Zn-dependent dehydrogenase